MSKNIYLFFTVLIILLFNVNTFAVGEDEATKAYMAYYNFVIQEMRNVGELLKNDELKPTGYANPEKMEWFYGGVDNVLLLDLDDDNIPEMILRRSLYRDNKEDVYYPDKNHIYSWRSSSSVISLYTYKNGKIQLVEAHLPLGTDNMIHTSIGKDGKTYYYILYKTAGDFTRFYSLRNGKLTAIDKIEIYFSHDWYINSDLHSSYGEYVYFTGNENYINAYSSLGIDLRDQWKISKKEYDNIFNKYTANGITDIKLEDYECKTEQQVTELMQAYLPESFVRGYYNPSNWAKNIVDNAINSNVVPKNLQCMYNQPITRQEFCQLANQYYETSTGEEANDRMWFADTDDVSVQKMGALGVITGVGNNMFNPDGYLTREQAAVILVRLANILGSELTESNPTFADNTDISKWAFESVGQVQSAKIMSGVGDNMFSPKSLYTREQSISTIMDIGTTQNSIDNLQITQSYLELLPTWTKQLETKITDTKGNGNKLITWESSNENVAIVDRNSGLVTGIGEGTTTIKAIATGGVSDSCIVKVFPLTTKNYYVDIPDVINYYDQDEKMGIITISDVIEDDNKYINLKGNATRHRTKDDAKDSHSAPGISYYVEDMKGNILSSGRKYLSFAWDKSIVGKDNKGQTIFERSDKEELDFRISVHTHYDTKMPLKITILDYNADLPKSEYYSTF